MRDKRRTFLLFNLSINKIITLTVQQSTKGPKSTWQIFSRLMCGQHCNSSLNNQNSLPIGDNFITMMGQHLNILSSTSIKSGSSCIWNESVSLMVSSFNKPLYWNFSARCNIWGRSSCILYSFVLVIEIQNYFLTKKIIIKYRV